MERPEEVNVSRKAGEALIERLQGAALTAQDRRVLEQVLRWYCWRLFAGQEARFSLKRLRALLCGDKPKRRKESAADQSSGLSEGDGDAGGARVAHAQGDSAREAAGTRRPGHGRQGAEAYRGAEHVVCHHETLAAGERCPVCGRGRVYRVAPGVEMRLEGHALLSAVRSSLETFRCSACGQGCTAAAPAEAGADNYSARARAVLVVGRSYLGVPLYRLEGYQAMGGVPVADATPWEQIERVAEWAYPVFAQLTTLTAQGDVLSQDETPGRIVSLMAANRRAPAEGTPEERTGMDTTALVAQQGAHTLCLSCAGRPQAGETLETLLTHREADRGKPLGMSDALAVHAADETALIRCHGLAHGRRKFAELEDVLPAEGPVVMEARAHVFDHEEEARVQQRNPTER